MATRTINDVKNPRWGNFEQTVIDLDVDFDDKGQLVKRTEPSQDSANSPLPIDRPAEQEDDGNYSDSDSDVSFGGNDAEAQGFGADGVPMEKYKSLESKLVELMKKATAQKKEYKPMRKEHR